MKIPPYLQVLQLHKNPVLRREMQKRSASVFGLFALLLWLLGLLALVYLLYKSATEYDRYDNYYGYSSRDYSQLGTLGRQIFEWIIFIMFMFLLFFVPGLTGGSISGERDRQTLVPLQLTLVSPVEIVIGKLLAALSFIGLLIISSAPLLSIGFLFGGIGLHVLLAALGMILLIGLTAGSIGVFFSAFFKGTVTSTVASYVFTWGSFIGFWFFLFIFGSFFFYNMEESVPAVFFALSPVSALADAVPSNGVSNGDALPLTGIKSSLMAFSGDRNWSDRDFDGRLWVWHVHALLSFALIAFSVKFASSRLKTPANKER